MSISQLLVMKTAGFSPLGVASVWASEALPSVASQCFPILCREGHHELSPPQEHAHLSASFFSSRLGLSFPARCAVLACICEALVHFRCTASRACSAMHVARWVCSFCSALSRPSLSGMVHGLTGSLLLFLHD